MTSKHALFAFAACAGVLATPVYGLAPGRFSTTAQVQIVDSGGIQVVTPVTLPSIGPIVTGGTTSGPSNTSNDAGKAELTIRGEAGEVLSMAVPSNLTLVRTGGNEALTLNTSAGYGLAGRGVLMGGQLINGNAMSVDVGNRLSLASADHVVPGPYEGLFVVVVQYN